MRAELNNALSRIKGLLQFHPHLFWCLFSPESISQNELRASRNDILKGLSSGEVVLVKIALDIWNESGHTEIVELLKLDDRNRATFVNAFLD